MADKTADTLERIELLLRNLYTHLSKPLQYTTVRYVITETNTEYEKQIQNAKSVVFHAVSGTIKLSLNLQQSGISYITLFDGDYLKLDNLESSNFLFAFQSDIQFAVLECVIGK